MDKFRKLGCMLALIFIYLAVDAQETVSNEIREGGFMRSEAKLYVVMVVVITILAGLLFYLVRLDNKITKLEKGNQ